MNISSLPTTQPAHKLAILGAAWVMVVAAVLGSMAHAESVPVPTVAVQPQSSGAMVVLDGVIEAVKQSTVSAQASGRIASFVVKAGDKVRAGQTLATIDDREAWLA